MIARTWLPAYTGLIFVTGLAWAQYDPSPQQINEDEVFATGFQVAKVSPHAFVLTRAQNNKFGRVVRAIRNDRLKSAMRNWVSLIQDVSLSGGPLPDFDTMAFTVAREAYLEESKDLVQAADTLRFRSERLRVIREELALIVQRIRDTTAQQEIDQLELEKADREVAESTAKQEKEDAEENLSQVMESVRFVVERIHSLVRELQAAVDAINQQVD